MQREPHSLPKALRLLEAVLVQEHDLQLQPQAPLVRKTSVFIRSERRGRRGWRRGGEERNERARTRVMEVCVPRRSTPRRGRGEEGLGGAERAHTCYGKSEEERKSSMRKRGHQQSYGIHSGARARN